MTGIPVGHRILLASFGPSGPEYRHTHPTSDTIRRMAELDYAYLADFAAVQEGKLNAIGASFTFVRVHQVPAIHTLFIAGRVRAGIEDGDVPISVQITPPDESYKIDMGGFLNAGPDAIPYGDGKVGLLFVVNAQLPLVATGLYTVIVSVEGNVARRLAFEVELVSVS